MTGDRHSVGSHRRRANKVGSGLLQEARAKLARLQVKSERPGLAAGAFAFCGVRTAFFGKGLRAWRSLGVGQRSGVAEVLADLRGRARELSRCFRIARIDRPRDPFVAGSQFQRPESTNA